MQGWQIISAFYLVGSFTWFIRLACSKAVAEIMRHLGKEMHDPKDINQLYKVGEHFKELNQVYVQWQTLATSVIDGAFFFIGWNFMKEKPSLFRICICIALIYWVLFSFIPYRHYYVFITLTFVLLLYVIFFYDLYTLIKNNPSIENADIYLIFAGLQLVNGIINLGWSSLFLKKYD
jgi:hypothetical protein